jgi:hypothetical protein
MHSRRLATLLSVLAALSVTACGASDAVADQCLQEAERIQDSRARTAAEEACRAAKDGEVSTEDAKRRARERCLEESDRIANEQARADAARRCEDIR